MSFEGKLKDPHYENIKKGKKIYYTREAVEAFGASRKKWSVLIAINKAIIKCALVVGIMRWVI